MGVVYRPSFVVRTGLWMLTGIFAGLAVVGAVETISRAVDDGDAFGLVAVFVFAGWTALTWRGATLKLQARPDGVVIRNLFVTHSVPWNQIVDFRVTSSVAWFGIHVVLTGARTLVAHAVTKSLVSSARRKVSRADRVVDSLNEMRAASVRSEGP